MFFMLVNTGLHVLLTWKPVSRRLINGVLMVSLDVVSLLTRVPLVDTLSLLEKKFDAKTVKLFNHVLTSSYFSFEEIFYEQRDGVAMGSPLSPAIADFFMENFEKKALSTAPRRQNVSSDMWTIPF